MFTPLQLAGGAGGGGASTIYGKDGGNVALANTLDLTASTGELLTVTGDGDLQDIVLPDGQVRVLYFQGTVTLQPDGNILDVSEPLSIAPDAMIVVRGVAGNNVKLQSIQSSYFMPFDADLSNPSEQATTVDTVITNVGPINKALGVPDNWLKVIHDGTTYRIPLYATGGA